MNLKIFSSLKYFLITYLLVTQWSNADFLVPKENNHNQHIAYKMYNMSVQMTKQAKLPCFIELNRKYVWLDVNKDQIISIDSNIIINDRRYAIELSTDCFSLFQTNDKTDKNKSDTLNGCWIYLIINYVLLNDESLYICQTDTMLSTRVHLTVLVSPYLNKNVYLNRQKHDRRYQNNLNVIEGHGIELVCGAAGKPKPVTKWFSKGSNKNSSTFLKMSETLFLANMTRNSTKKYECIAENGVNPSLSRTFSLNIIFPPVITKLEVLRVGCNFYQIIEIICEVEANPGVEIKWRFNKNELNTFNQNYVSSLFAYEIKELPTYAESVHISKLIVKNFNLDKLNKKFECIAENKLGIVKRKISVCKLPFNQKITKNLHSFISNNEEFNKQEIIVTKKTLTVRKMFKFDEDEKVQKKDANVSYLKTTFSQNLSSFTHIHTSGVLQIIFFALLIVNILIF